MSLVDSVKKTFEKYKSCDSLRDKYVKIVGNRITFLCRAGFQIGGMGAIIESYHRNPDAGFAYALLALASFAGYAATGKGDECTLEHYVRGKKHIKKYGRLRKRYAETMLASKTHGRFYGYCQQQGLYLAAKELGEVEVFRAVDKEVDNRNYLPNF